MTRSSWPSRTQASAIAGLSMPQAAATGSPDSRRTRSATGARKAGPQGTLAFRVEKPTLTLR